MDCKNETMYSISLKHACMEKISKSVLSTSERIKIVSVRLPLDISQEIFDFSVGQLVGAEVDNILACWLRKPAYTPLSKICLTNAGQADVNLIYDLVKANLRTLCELDIRGCRILPKKFWLLLSKATQLKSLKTTNLRTAIRCPSLKAIVVDWKPTMMLQRVQQHFQSTFYDNLLENVLGNLTFLDLSWCPWAKRLQSLKNAKFLEALILRNCDIAGLMNDIFRLKELRILDISVGVEQEFHQEHFSGKYSNPQGLLIQLLKALPRLEYLDISGTNLIPTREMEQSLTSVLDARSVPLKFLGMYSLSSPATNELCIMSFVPAIQLTGSGNPEILVEAIKRNVDMPKTLRNQISKLRSINGSSTDVNLLLGIQIKMLKNLRTDEHFKFWALKCLHNFLIQSEASLHQISTEARKELFLILNRFNYNAHYPQNSQSKEIKHFSELALRFSFQIFLKLLPTEETGDEKILKEVMRLAKFLISLDRTSLLYFKTEAILFRLLYRLSLEPTVCLYLCQNNVVLNCFEFFKTIQVYLGFSLRISQTSEIVVITWKLILRSMQVSPKGIQHFLKHRGLSWMYAHLTWFAYDERTQTALRSIFMDALNIVESQRDVNGNRQPMPRSSQELMIKVKGMVLNVNSIRLR